MDHENLKVALDQRIDALRKRIEALHEEVMQAEKELTDHVQLAKALEHMPLSTLKTLRELTINEGDSTSKTQFQRIEECLQENGNSPITIPDIMEATGISRSSVSAVLYRTHASSFVKIDSDDSRLSRWRLRTAEDIARAAEDIPF